MTGSIKLLLSHLLIVRLAEGSCVCVYECGFVSLLPRSGVACS